MNRTLKQIAYIFVFVSMVLSGSCNQTNKTKKRPGNPNIVIILFYDQGNADAGYRRNPLTVSTRSIDNKGNKLSTCRWHFL